MAHLLLRHAIALAAAHAHSQRKRKRAPKTLAPIQPSHADEFWYRHQLGEVAHHAIDGGARVVAALEPRWPGAVADTWTVRDGIMQRAEDARRAYPPGFERVIDEEARRFGEITSTADRMASQLAARVSRTVDRRLAAEIARSIGIDIGPLFDASEMVAPMREAIRDNVALIKSIPREYFGSIRDAVRKAYVEGWRWEQLVARLREVSDAPLVRAKIIARDQVSKLNASFNEARQTGLGIKRYYWRGVMDQRERPTHKQMEGVVCRWDSPPEVDGERVHPGEAILCRCSAIPIIDVAEILGVSSEGEDGYMTLRARAILSAMQGAA